MSPIQIQVLEISFRGYPRKRPYLWALHFDLAFACLSSRVPDFLAEQIEEVKGFFQLPQDFRSIGLWGQFQQVDVRADNDIGLGPRRIWRTHGQVAVSRERLWDAWARAKFVYTFHALPAPVWFKTDVAFRCVYVRDLAKRWGKPSARAPISQSTLCYSGADSAFSIETALTGRPTWSLTGLD